MASDEEQADDGTPIATVAEALVAYKALTTAQRRRLFLTGEDLLAAMGRYGRTGDDLIQEAILLVYKGDRKWRPNNVTFLPFLMGVIKSIASHTAESYSTQKRQEPAFESELIREGVDGDAKSPLDDIAGACGIDDQLVQEEVEIEADARLAEVFKFFESDEQVFEMLVNQQLGLKGPEIQKEMKLTDAEFKAVDRRRRRGFAQLGKKD